MTYSRNKQRHMNKARSMASGKRRAEEKKPEHKPEMVSLDIKNEGQRLAWEALTDSSIRAVILHGTAGTGKTFLAGYRALQLKLSKQVERIYLTRPTIEAGHVSLGYLPGNLEEKMDPYLIPLMETLQELAAKRWETIRHDVEVAPIQYMRGRTFKNCVLVVDEAQNMKPAEMLMLLTRVGENAWVIITGDPAQKDIDCESGLEYAARVCRDSSIIQSVALTQQDVVRSRLAREVLRLWNQDDYEDIEDRYDD